MCARVLRFADVNDDDDEGAINANKFVYLLTNQGLGLKHKSHAFVAWLLRGADFTCTLAVFALLWSCLVPRRRRFSETMSRERETGKYRQRKRDQHHWTLPSYMEPLSLFTPHATGSDSPRTPPHMNDSNRNASTFHDTSCCTTVGYVLGGVGVGQGRWWEQQACVTNEYFT